MYRWVSKWSWSWLMIVMMPLQAMALQEDPDEARVAIERAMDLSGLNAMIGQLPAMAETGAQQSAPPGMSAEDVQKAQAILLEAFDPLKLHRLTTENFRKEYDREKFKTLLIMLGSPLAQKMTRFETDAMTPEVQQAMMSFAATLESQPPSPQRVALISRLMDVSGSVDAMVAIQAGMMESMMRAMNPWALPGQSLTEEQMTAMLQDARIRMRDDAQQYLLVQGLFMYRTASDQELEDYIALYTSETGRWFIPMSNRVMIAVFKEIGATMAARMAEEAVRR